MKVGGASHSFCRFNDANLKFLTMETISDLMRWNDINDVPKTGGIGELCRTSRAALRNSSSDAPNATVRALLCAIQSTQNVTRDGESMPVTSGMFYMSVEVQDWQWCGCGQQEGKFLEFNFTVRVPDHFKISRRNATSMPVKLSLGTNDYFVTISSKVSNYWSRVMTQYWSDSKLIFAIRCAKTTLAICVGL